MDFLQKRLLTHPHEMFGCEVLDVFDEFGGVDDFDVIGEAIEKIFTFVGDNLKLRPTRI